jgi:hypothetical protein
MFVASALYPPHLHLANSRLHSLRLGEAENEASEDRAIHFLVQLEKRLQLWRWAPFSRFDK